MLNTPFNYTGSKYKLLEQIYNQLPNSSEYDNVIDLFVGGGSFSINFPVNKYIICNDVIAPLIYFYNSIKSLTFDELLENITKTIISKDDPIKYGEIRTLFNDSGAIDPYMFFNLVCSCTNNMMRFNKSYKFNQTFGKRSFNDNTKEKLKLYYDKIHLGDYTFINNSFELVDIPNNSLIYLDPPYLITEAGYNCYWNQSLDDKLINLVDTLHNTGNKFMLSNVSMHNNEVYKNFSKLSKYNVIDMNMDYNKVSRTGNKSSKEVLIKNF